jgi:hypothetical protein
MDRESLSRDLSRFDGQFRRLSIEERVDLCHVIEALCDAPKPLSLHQLEVATAIKRFYLGPLLQLGKGAD